MIALLFSPPRDDEIFETLTYITKIALPGFAVGYILGRKVMHRLSAIIGYLMILPSTIYYIYLDYQSNSLQLDAAMATEGMTLSRVIYPDNLYLTVEAWFLMNIPFPNIMIILVMLAIPLISSWLVEKSLKIVLHRPS